MLRLGVGLFIVPLFGAVAFFAVIFTGWGFEEDPVDQFRRDLPMLVTSTVTGLVAGAALAYALFGAQRVLLILGAALGMAPALLISAAYFTDAM